MRGEKGGPQPQRPFLCAGTVVQQGRVEAWRHDSYPDTFLISPMFERHIFLVQFILIRVSCPFNIPSSFPPPMTSTSTSWLILIRKQGLLRDKNNNKIN